MRLSGLVGFAFYTFLTRVRCGLGQKLFQAYSSDSGADATSLGSRGGGQGWA